MKRIVKIESNAFTLHELYEGKNNSDITKKAAIDFDSINDPVLSVEVLTKEESLEWIRKSMKEVVSKEINSRIEELAMICLCKKYLAIIND